MRCFLVLLICATICCAMPCDYDTDKLLGSTCFEFVELPMSNFKGDESMYVVGENYCSKHGKHLAIAKSPGEQYFLANALNTLHWTDALVGLRYQKTPWSWAADGTYLRGQGCARTSFDADLIATLPSTYSDAMTKAKCIEFCSKEERLFAAIQDGSYCYCSNVFVWDESSTNCSIPCSGASGEKCGTAFNSAIQFTAEDAYDNWQSGMPTTGSCAAIKVDGHRNPWVDTSCSLTLPFFCKFVETKATPYGSDRSACSQNACYYYFSTPELTWQAADRFCIKSGGRLATVESEDRQGIISAILSDPNIKAKQIWIGASNRDWYFPDNSPLTQREGWVSQNEPINQETNACADLIVGALSADDLVYGYRSRPCTRVQDSDSSTVRFICSAPARDEEIASPVPPITSPLATKPFGTPTPATPKRNPTTPSTPAATSTRDEITSTDVVLADALRGMAGDVVAIEPPIEEAPPPVTLSTEPPRPTTTSKKFSLGDPSVARQVALDGEIQKKKSQTLFGDSSETVDSNDLPWWGILLIVLASLILIALVVLVLVYVFKKSQSGGKTSGRISPMSSRPMIMGTRLNQRVNYANSRTSSARTSHGRNSQVLLY